MQFSGNGSADTHCAETGEVQPLADDLLKGADAIADFTGLRRRQVYRAVSETKDGKPNLPVFRLGAVICARKSTLMRWIEEQEARARRE